MIFETELSEKLNSELESAGISVSETLIAKTLAAVQAARTTEVNEVPDAEWVGASEENAEKLIELAKARKGRRIKGAGPVLFRVATVMAACFVLVVGAFALRFSTMRMGKEEAAQAPMMAGQNGSARNGVTYAVDAESIAEEDFKYFRDTMESMEMESPAMAESPAAYLTAPVTTTAEGVLADDADAVIESEAVEECEKAEASDIQEEVKLLTEQLAQAETVQLLKNEQGIRWYEFFVRDSVNEPGYYRVYEDGAVEFTELPPVGQNSTWAVYDASENKEFRRALLVWMKKHGYSF